MYKKMFCLGLSLFLIQEISAQIRFAVQSITNLTSKPVIVRNTDFNEIAVIKSGESYKDLIIKELSVNKFFELNFSWQINHAKKPLAHFEAMVKHILFEPMTNFYAAITTVQVLGDYEPLVAISKEYPYVGLENDEESWTFNINIILKEPLEDSIITYKLETKIKR